MCSGGSRHSSASGAPDRGLGFNVSPPSPSSFDRTLVSGVDKDRSSVQNVGGYKRRNDAPPKARRRAAWVSRTNHQSAQPFLLVCPSRG